MSLSYKLTFLQNYAKLLILDGRVDVALQLENRYTYMAIPLKWISKRIAYITKNVHRILLTLNEKRIFHRYCWRLYI